MTVRQVTQQGRTFWMVDVTHRYPDGRVERVRKVARVQNKRGAETEERETLAALVGGTYKRKEAPVPAPKEVPTFAAFAAEFERTYAAANNKPSERARKEWTLRLHLVPAFGAARLDEIGPAAIERYKAAGLAAGRAPKSINNELGVLRKVLAVAAEWGEFAGPVPKVRAVRVPEPEFDFLDFDEAARLLAAAGDARPEVTLALRAGLRIGELRALRWDDVDLKAGKMRVRWSAWRDVVGTTKSGKPREVPLSADALGALRVHWHLRGPLVFGGGADGQRLRTVSEMRHALACACRRARLRVVGWHVLRHTFASHLVMRGAPIKTVQELLGHASLAVTLRYAHLSPDARRDAVQLLDGPAANSSGNPAATRGVVRSVS